MVKAGLQAIYLSGWQVAADANLSEQVYPDQSLYAANSVPAVVRRINNALRRADQIEWAESGGAGDRERHRHWMVPIVADAEAGFGGALNAFELMKGMIEAGAAGVHFEDQLSSEKKCGHMGGKVLDPDRPAHPDARPPPGWPPTSCGVPTLVVARTDSLGANLLTSDVDERDRAVLHRRALARGLLLRASGHGHRRGPRPGLRPLRRPDLVRDLDARPRRGPGLRRAHQGPSIPDKMLAYNCSPSFNWKKHLDDQTIARFQKELGAMGYSFQFVTLAGWHALNESTFALARGYAERGMSAYVELQQREFALEERRLHRHPPPARGRRRLLRRRHDHAVRRHGVDPGAGRLHRGGPVRLRD